MKQVKNIGCVVLLLALNVLSSFGEEIKLSDNESFLDFEILDEQNKTCRLKKCVLNKPMKVVVPETAVISGKTYKLTTIGNRSLANYGCQKYLLQVELPPTITTIEESAFYSCDSLKQILLPKCLITIGPTAFYDCDGLAEITFPNSVTKIGEGAFAHCNKLTSVTLPTSVVEVEACAFYSSPLSQVFVPKSVKTIGIRAFDCNVIVDSDNPNYSSEDGVLLDKTRKKLISVPIHRTSYTIPKSVEIIGYNAFSDCSELTQVNIPSYLKEIGDYAFAGTSIKEINIPNSVTSIGKKAFLNCWNISEIVIPNSVKVIGDSAFWQCNSLTHVTLPNSLKEISSGMFEMCQHLTNIEIPKTLTVIGPRAFRRTSISNITLPTSLVKIGDWSFMSCDYLEQIALPDSLIEIGQGAFSYCSYLKQITIPPSVKTIGDRAFPKNCEVEIGK